MVSSSKKNNMRKRNIYVVYPQPFIHLILSYLFLFIRLMPIVIMLLLHALKIIRTLYDLVLIDRNLSQNFKKLSELFFKSITFFLGKRCKNCVRFLAIPFPSEWFYEFQAHLKFSSTLKANISSLIREFFLRLLVLFHLTWYLLYLLNQ